MYCYCKCSVALPHRAVPWVGLQCVIVLFPGHTHLLFSSKVHTLCTLQLYTYKRIVVKSSCQIICTFCKYKIALESKGFFCGITIAFEYISTMHSDVVIHVYTVYMLANDGHSSREERSLV